MFVLVFYIVFYQNVVCQVLFLIQIHCISESKKQISYANIACSIAFASATNRVAAKLCAMLLQVYCCAGSTLYCFMLVGSTVHMFFLRFVQGLL